MKIVARTRQQRKNIWSVYRHCGPDTVGIIIIERAARHMRFQSN